MNILQLLFFIISWQVSLPVVNRILSHNKSDCLARVSCYDRTGPFAGLIISIPRAPLHWVWKMRILQKMLNIFFKAPGTFIWGEKLTSAPQKWCYVSSKMRFKTAFYHFHLYRLCHFPQLLYQPLLGQQPPKYHQNATQTSVYVRLVNK